MKLRETHRLVTALTRVLLTLYLCALPVQKRSMVSYFWQEGIDSEQIAYEILFPAEVSYPAGLPDDVLQHI